MMNNKNIGVCLVLLVLTLASCHPPRTIYLSNKSDHAFTLLIEEDVNIDKLSQEAVFRDSLNGRLIEPGHVVIHFGAGKWLKNDKEALKAMLSKTDVLIDGKERLRLPKDIKVNHYGLFVEELLVRFRHIE